MKKIIKNIYKKFMKNLFFGRFKNITIEFWHCYIYIIHKILVLLKNHLNDLKDNFFGTFF